MRLESDTHLFRAVPDRFATVLHLAGRSEWSMRDTRWSTAPGMVGVKIPNEVYAERVRRGRGAFEVVLFDASLVAGARTVLERRPALPRDNALDNRDPRAQPLVAFHRMLAGDASPAALEQAACDAVSALVELTCAPSSTRPSSVSSAAVARARALLDARITETVGLDELAAHARLDKFRLCRAFRDEIGLPPHAYVSHRRVCLAQELLARGVGQAEVAAQVGLYDQSQLHRHFKRILGVTPGAYARAVR
jgi:AraC-like DNA-binding protein